MTTSTTPTDANPAAHPAAVHLPATEPGPHARRALVRGRRPARVLLATALLTATTLAAGPAVAAVNPASAGSPVVLTDWSGRGWGGDGSASGDGQSDPWGSSGSGGSSGGSSGTGTGTAEADPASKAQSTGVVLIDTVLGYQSVQAAGTGLVLTSGGEVLTNYHVVEGATSIKVTIATTGTTYTATVVGHDQTDDIALLQLAKASGLATATIDDDTVRTGDAVTAVGNAGGTGTLTAADGTVTALNQTISTESESGTAGETLHGLIETDADVVAGDSGGPLYDDEGEVVGIDTAASSGGAIDGYAIPIAHALTIAHQILSGTETSTVQIGASAFLGVEVSAAATDLSGNAYPGQDAGWEDSSTAGARVAGVVDDSPAATAGLTAGDVITAIGGTTVTTAEEVSTLLQGHDAGDRVALTWTDGQGTSHTTTVTLAASPVA